MLVIVQNGYAAATVTVEDGPDIGLQRLSTSLCGIRCTPANVIMMVGMPLALGSYWGLVLVIPGMLVLVFRILDEEKLLTQELAGYREYAQHVRYRLVPCVVAAKRTSA